MSLYCAAILDCPVREGNGRLCHVFPCASLAHTSTTARRCSGPQQRERPVSRPSSGGQKEVMCRVSLHGPVPSLSLSWLTRCMVNDSSRGEVRFSELGMENSRALRPVTAQVVPSRPAIRRASLHGPVPLLSLSWLTFAWVLFFARRGSISRFRHGKRSSSPPRDRGGRALSAGNGRLS